MLRTSGKEFLLSILLSFECILFVSVYYVMYSVPSIGPFLAFAESSNTSDFDRSPNISITIANQTSLDGVEKLYDKGYLMSKLGKYEDAMIYFDKVLEIDPNHIDSLYFKGLTLSDLGRDEEAIEYFDRVLTLKPESLRALRQQG